MKPLWLVRKRRLAGRALWLEPGGRGRMIGDESKEYACLCLSLLSSPCLKKKKNHPRHTTSHVILTVTLRMNVVRMLKINRCLKAWLMYPSLRGQ